MKKQENGAFIAYSNEDQGCLLDDSVMTDYPIKYYNIINGIGIDAFSDECSYYGFIYEGQTDLISVDRPAIKLEKGMYFSLTGPFLLNPDCKSKIVVVEVLHTKGIYPKNNYKAMFHVGGKIEKHGRLKYIDGCTDSLLIPPIKMGDPCFNHLHFPPAISQTSHTHPTSRIGLVVKGNGLCVTPFGDLDLKEGMIFVIKSWDGQQYKKGTDGKDHEVGSHSFFTYEESMDVVAFHPDSDFGATDVNHPMINRTIVDGIPANQIDNIQTKS